MATKQPFADETLMAARDGSLDELSRLLALGASPDSMDEYGWTATMHSAFHGHELCLSLLIAHGCQFDARVPLSGRTAAIFAATKGHDSCLLSLIAAGSNINLVDSKGWTAAFYAAQYGQKSSLSLLIGAGANLDAVDLHGLRAADYAMKEGRSGLAAFMEASALSTREKKDIEQSAMASPSKGIKTVRL